MPTAVLPRTPRSLRRKPGPWAKPNPAHPLGQPAACWLMNEGGGTTLHDLSKGGNNATLTGGVTWVPGNFGGPALKFDGSSGYANCGAGAALAPAAGFAFFVWYKSSSATRQMLATKGDFNQAKQWYLELYDGDVVRAVLNFAGVSGGILSSSAGNWRDGAWHRAGLTWDGASTWTLWGDGRSLGTFGSGSADNAGQSLLLGNTSPDGWFNGLMEDARLYPQAPTAAQIWQDYAEPFAFLQQPAPRRALVSSAAAGGAAPVGKVVAAQQAVCGAAYY